LLNKTVSKPPADDHPIEADMRDGDSILAPMVDFSDTILRESPAPAIRVDQNGMLMEANEQGRSILAMLGYDKGRRAPDRITRQIPGVLLSGCARNVKIKTHGQHLTLTITTLDDRTMGLMPRKDAANPVLVLVDRPKTESPALQMLPMALYTSTRDRRHGDCWISSGVAGLTGFSPSRFTSDAGFWMSRIHPVDRPGVIEDLKKLEAARRASTEYRFKCADGVYRWMADQMELPPGATVFGMMHDIDIRKRDELAIQKRNDLLGMLLDEVSPGAVVLDKKGLPLYMNPRFAAGLGFSREDFLGGQCRLRFHPDDSSAGLEALSNAVLGTPAQCMVRVGLKDGGWRQVRFVMSPLAWNGRKLALCTASDMMPEGWTQTGQNPPVRTDVYEHIPFAVADPATGVSASALGAIIRGRLGEKGKAGLARPQSI